MADSDPRLHIEVVDRGEVGPPNWERFYELCWHLGGSQGDIASLTAEDVDWKNRTISFTRKKTRVPVILHLGEEALNTLNDLPGDGLVFPCLARVRAGDHRECGMVPSGNQK